MRQGKRMEMSVPDYFENGEKAERRAGSILQPLQGYPSFADYGIAKAMPPIRS
jgi:hypothetical protein